MTTALTKKLSATVALLTLLGVGIVGCAPADSTSTPAGGNASAAGTNDEKAEEAPEPVSLEGSWMQNNSNAEDAWQAATITGNTIEVHWVGDNGDTKSLYWAGTVEVPAGADTFSFESVNDTTKTDVSIMASGDATKKFTYENDELSYEVTAMGTTMTVRLSRE